MTVHITAALSIFAVCALASPSFCAAGQAYPPNWPWRGIVVHSTSASDEKDIRRLAAMNVNSVEISLDVRRSATFKKISGEEALKRDISWADSTLDACKRYGITGIITIAQIPVDPSTGLTQESAEFWENPERLKEAVAVAGRLAAHFKGRGAELGAYEVLSEPLLRDKGRLEVPQAWPRLVRDIVKEIRRHDAGRHIIVTPGPGGMPDGYDGFEPLEDPRIIYGAHVYTPHNYTHQGIYGNPRGIRYPGRMPFKYWDRAALEAFLAPLIEFGKRHGVPVFIGEFSAVRWAPGADEYLKDLISIFDSHGWGWAYFSYKSWHGWDPDYDTGYATDAPEDWKRHYAGKDTARWGILKDAFGKNRRRGTGER